MTNRLLLVIEMKLENINVNETLEKAKKQLAAEKNISPALKSTFEILILLITILINRLSVTSKNSSKPPSDDKNRK